MENSWFSTYFIAGILRYNTPLPSLSWTSLLALWDIYSKLNAALSSSLALQNLEWGRKRPQMMEGKVLCTSWVRGARNSHTFQFDFILLLIHARIITELVVILFLLIWRVQGDHCALRKRDARTYYYLQIRATYLNEEIPWLLPRPATSREDNSSRQAITRIKQMWLQISALLGHTPCYPSQNAQRKKK